MNTVVTDNENLNVPALGPGERLRAARVSLGYEIERVIDELHLTRSVVEALERDEYDDLPARVFVRGYIRKYAKVVGLPDEPILKLFDDNWPEDRGASTLINSKDNIPNLPSDVRSSNPLMRGVSWLLLAAAIVLFLIWWRGHLDQFIDENAVDVSFSASSESQELSTKVESQPVPKAEEVVKADVQVASDDQFVITLPPPNVAESAKKSTEGEVKAVAAENEEIVATEPSVADASVDANDSAPTSEPSLLSDIANKTINALKIEEKTITEPEAQPQIVESDPVQEAPAAIVIPVEPKPTQLVADSGVVFNFNSPCWVDVRDSTRTFKLFGEMKEGARKVLGGSAPYKVVLGNASAVSITVNGENYDFTEAVKGNVARFTINP